MWNAKKKSYTFCEVRRGCGVWVWGKVKNKAKMLKELNMLSENEVKSFRSFLHLHLGL